MLWNDQHWWQATKSGGWLTVDSWCCKDTEKGGQVHGCTPVIPAPRRLRQEDHEFKASQGYPNTKTNNQTTTRITERSEEILFSWHTYSLKYRILYFLLCSIISMVTWVTDQDPWGLSHELKEELQIMCRTVVSVDSPWTPLSSPWLYCPWSESVTHGVQSRFLELKFTNFQHKLEQKVLVLALALTLTKNFHTTF